MPPKPVHKHRCTRRPRGTGGPEAGGRGRHTCKATDHPHCPHQSASQSDPRAAGSPDSPVTTQWLGAGPRNAHALTARPQVGNGAPAHAPLALLLQPISEKAWAICDSCQPGRISSGIHLRAPQTPLVPETLPLKTPPGLPTVQVLPGPHGSTPSPFAVLSPDSETRWGRGTGLLSVGLMATHSRRPHCRPLALLWDPVQAAPVRPQSSSVPVSAFPISPTPLSLRPTPLL